MCAPKIFSRNGADPWTTNSTALTRALLFLDIFQAPQAVQEPQECADH